MSRRHSAEYLEGAAAADAEEGSWSNPYDPATREYDDWSNGYINAKEAAQQAEADEE